MVETLHVSALQRVRVVSTWASFRHTMSKHSEHKISPQQPRTASTIIRLKPRHA